MVDWTTSTSEVLLGPCEFWEGLLEAVFEANFCLEEDFIGAWETEPIPPSTGGVAYDFDVVGLYYGLRELGNNWYRVLDRE